MARVDSRNTSSRGGRGPSSNRDDGRGAFLTSTDQENADTPKEGHSDQSEEQDDRPVTAGAVRQKALLREAEVRAEHQAAARATMLELSDRLEELYREKQKVMKLLEQERERNTALSLKYEALINETANLREEEEKRLAELLVIKAQKSGNKVLWNMLLEKSREGFESKMFGRFAIEKDVRHTRDMAVGDRVTFHWIFRQWNEYVKQMKEEHAAEAAERERKRKEEELRKWMDEEIRKRSLAWQSRVAELEKELVAARQHIQQQDNQIRQHGVELEKVRMAAAEEVKQLLAAMDRLRAELRASQQAYAEMEARNQALKREMEEMVAAFRNKEAELQAEITRMKETIRRLTGELDQALILAKHMRETALKAKRDASHSIHPDKFAQLVTELEVLKDKLTAVSKDFEKEKHNNDLLKEKLDKNTRRLELERQFLPFLHQARGPLGAKNGWPKYTHGGGEASPASPEMGKEKDQGWQASATPSPVSTKKRMQASQSLGMLPGRGSPLGGCY